MSTFKKYYENEDFRTKHLEYMKEKVPCSECGFVTARANMSAHKKSRNCKTKDKQKQKEKELLKEIKKLKSKLKEQDS